MWWIIDSFKEAYIPTYILRIIVVYIMYIVLSNT